jgi:CheY-like chemotaxis protein
MIDTLQPAKILVIDDMQVDFVLIEAALQSLRIGNEIVHVRSGAKGIEILKASSDEAGHTPFQIILLDLNMPQMNGLEFLENINALGFKASPKIFMMTTSEYDTDIKKAYERNIDGYIFKSDLVEGLKEALSQLKSQSWTVFSLPQST